MASVWTVDGISSGWSRVESPDGKMAHLPTEWLPVGVREGDVIAVSVSSGGESRTVTLKVDAEVTRERREEMEGVRASIPSAPGGDVDL